MGPTAIAVAGLVLSGVGTAANIVQQRSAQKQQKQQFEESNRLAAEGQAKQKQLADIRSMRERRAAAREAQQRRAEVVAGATQRGAAAASPVQGAVSSIATQAGSNVSFLDQSNRLQQQASDLFGQAQVIANTPIQTSSIPSGIASLGSTLFNNNTKISALFR